MLLWKREFWKLIWKVPYFNNCLLKKFKEDNCLLKNLRSVLEIYESRPYVKSISSTPSNWDQQLNPQIYLWSWILLLLVIMGHTMTYSRPNQKARTFFNSYYLCQKPFAYLDQSTAKSSSIRYKFLVLSFCLSLLIYVENELNSRSHTISKVEWTLRWT